MAKRNIGTIIQCAHFRFRLFSRAGVIWADGRANKPRLGRYSLGVTSMADARQSVIKLDIAMAEKHGLVPPSMKGEALTISDGIDRYLQYSSRPYSMGGVKPSTLPRYRGVLRQFADFVSRRAITQWRQVSDHVIGDFIENQRRIGHLDSTLRVEIKIVRQAINYLVRFENLPSIPKSKLRRRLSDESSRYCWRAAEVAAMINHCRKSTSLDWLGDVIIALSSTGLRISELLLLRWSDFSGDLRMLRLPDESAMDERQLGRATRTLKSGTSRVLPVHRELRELLQRMPRHVDGLVFHGVNSQPLTYDKALVEFRERVVIALVDLFPTPRGEIGFSSGRFHSFRHYFCSRCANSGVPERAVMKWLGHSSSAIIKYYYHLHDEEARDRIDKVDLGLGASSSE